MMVWMRLAVFMAVVLASASAVAAPKPLIVDLAEDHVDITTGFNGAHLVLFGVREQAGDIAIVIRGPARKTIVRRKEQVLGAWMNRSSMQFRKVPSYYDYALSAPEQALLPPAILKAEGIGLNALYFDPDYSDDDSELVQNFQEALIRTRQLRRIYPTAPTKIEFLSDRLFRAEFYVPANVPPGQYRIDTFLIDDQRILAREETQLRVAQVGFSATVYDLAYNYGAWYGLGCIMIALLAGWGINFIRRTS